MKYYLSYKGKLLGYMMNKEEAEKSLRRIQNAIAGIEIIALDDKIAPISKLRRGKKWNKKS